jgi:DNA-binding PadR family transcriptional regulator
MEKINRPPRCRCKSDSGSYQVRARVERFIEPALLTLLADKPSYGYELAEALEDDFVDSRIDFGNLYRLLRSLEEEGLVSSNWIDEFSGPLKRIYSITEEGENLLDEWIKSLHDTNRQILNLIERYNKQKTKV